MADYITEEQLTAFGHEFGALSNPSAVTLLLSAASRFFDNQCEVPDDFFAVADDTETSRDFIGNGTAYLQLDPYTALDATDPVLLNDGSVDDPDFTTTNVPEYVERDGALVVLDRTGFRDFTYNGQSRFVGWPETKQIRVSAKWGFLAIPEDVQLACIHIAFHLWRVSDPAFAVISNSDGAAARALTLPQIAQTVIDKYKAKYSRRLIFA